MNVYDLKRPVSRGWSDDLQPIVLAGLGAGVISAVACMTYGLLVESLILPHIRPPGPMLSYGQESFVSLVFVSLLGASGGAVVPVAFHSQTGNSRLLYLLLLLPLLASACICLLNTLAWRYCIGRYGFDVSDLITFIPPYVAAAGALTCSLLAGLSRLLTRTTV